MGKLTIDIINRLDKVNGSEGLPRRSGIERALPICDPNFYSAADASAVAILQVFSFA
jgi:hypothetical protein